jgi:protein-L-isoaspartate O-methyltransferase
MAQQPVSFGSSVAIAGYAEAAPRLIKPWLALNPAEVHAPALYLFPSAPSRILDIGAGIGSDAAWFAAQGHSVLALEPVEALRAAGMLHYPSPRIEWLNDRLPDLAVLTPRRQSFDLVMISAVWAHLDCGERRGAMPIVASQIASRGRLIMSIREGWSPPSRPAYSVTAEETIRLAEEAGLTAILNTRSESIQKVNRAAGVTWLRLAFERG